MKRRLNDWLSGYLEYADESEPPTSYHTWVGVACIASTLQRKVFFKWGFETLYPNMYIILIGPSGKCRKGTAMRMGFEILKNVGVKIVSESITREALIRQMKTSVNSAIDPNTNTVNYHCSLTCFSEELSVFLGQSDVKFLADLTDWYDSKDKWTYETKNQGTDTIQGLCFNILGATAADWLVSILPQEAIGGGFTSRIIFVVEENKRRTLPKPAFTKRTRLLMEALKADLEHIGTLVGRFDFSPDTEEEYMAWYQQQDANTFKGIGPIQDPRFAGYCERRATHLRKLCMIFSASRGDDMIITQDDFKRALNTLKAVEVKMPRVFSGLGTAKYAQATEKILIYLASKKQVQQMELLTHFYRDVDYETLKIIEATLEKMGVIRVMINPADKQVVYQYIGQ